MHPALVSPATAAPPTTNRAVATSYLAHWSRDFSSAYHRRGKFIQKADRLNIQFSGSDYESVPQKTIDFVSRTCLARILHHLVRADCVARTPVTMVGQEIDVPNPPPLPSHLPHHVLQLAVKLEKKPLPEDVKQGLVDFQRAACYIAAGELPAPH